MAIRGYGMMKTKELKRFVYYSIYAWGFPCVLTIFTFMMDTYDLIDVRFKPNIGSSSCWFGKRMETFVRVEKKRETLFILENVFENLIILGAVHKRRKQIRTGVKI